MQNAIKAMIDESVETKALVKEKAPEIEQCVKMIVNAFKKNKKVLLAGNGGSASQAQHIAAEFVGRYKMERKALPSIALTTDTSILTAIANDYSYDNVFSRQIEALGNEGDIFISLSTSGNSKNLVNAVKEAKKMKMRIIGLYGKDGGLLKGTSDIEIIVPSKNTPRIQEAHLMILHIICELVDEELFRK